MGKRSTQLGRLTLALLITLLVASFVTGLGLWYIHEQREKLADLPFWTSACQTVHGLVNPLICLVLGFISATHMRAAWKIRANWKSGVLLTAMLVVLILTGVALYYSDNRHFYFTAHLIAGLLLPILLPVHWFMAKRWVRRSAVELDEADLQIRF
jgi:hypothetical protein